MPRALVAFSLAVVLAVLHSMRLSSTLPAVVAAHFDAAGNANGWIPRGAFIWFYRALLLVFVFAFGSGYASLRRERFDLKLPNRDYWLDPTRAPAAIAWVRSWVLWLGIGTLGFLMAAMQNAADVSNGTAGAASKMPFFIGTYLGLVGAMGMVFLKRFGRKGSA
jgi:hypothetical protein